MIGNGRHWKTPNAKHSKNGWCHMGYTSKSVAIWLVMIPPKSECGCLHGGVIENGRTHNPLILCSVYMYRCGCTYRVTLRVFSWGTLQQQLVMMSTPFSVVWMDLWQTQATCFFFFFYTLLIPCGKFGPAYLCKGYSSCKRNITKSYKCMLGLFTFP